MPGVQGPLREFETNFAQYGASPVSVVFEAGGFLHSLQYQGEIKSNANRVGRTDEINKFVLDGQTYFSYSGYLNQRKSSGTTTAIVLGSMGGFVALLGLFALFKGGKAKSK